MFSPEQANQLIEQLAELPGNIHGAELELVDAKNDKTTLEAHIELTAHQVITEAGGYNSLGKNENERKASQFDLLQGNQQYTDMVSALREHCKHIATAEADIQHLKNQFSAVKYSAQLMAAFRQDINAADSII